MSQTSIMLNVVAVAILPYVTFAAVAMGPATINPGELHLSPP